MHHPWRRLREQLPDWDVVWRPLPPGMLGGTDVRCKLIVLAPGQLQRQRRCTIDHELHHAEAGDVGCQHPKREAAIAQASARRLIPIDRLLDVLAWAHNAHEAADELWVDLDTFHMRMQHLHPAERAAVVARLRSRDNEE